MRIVKAFYLAMKEWTSSYINYFINTENCFVQVFYMLIGPFAYSIYFVFIYFMLYDQFPIYLNIFMNLITWMAFYFYYKALKTNPGTISKANVN